MKRFLEEYLPRWCPTLSFRCIGHEGKRDLEKSIPRKLRAWREPGVRFIVVRDNDRGDCRKLKQELLALCAERESETLVRIACQELEAWYLGDSNALAVAFGRETLRALPKKAKFRNPDAVQRPSDELKRLVPEFQKISGAQAMGRTMNVKSSENRSPSFEAFLSGVARLHAQLVSEPSE